MLAITSLGAGFFQLDATNLPGLLLLDPALFTSPESGAVGDNLDSSPVADTLTFSGGLPLPGDTLIFAGAPGWAAGTLTIG